MSRDRQEVKGEWRENGCEGEEVEVEVKTVRENTVGL